MAESLPAKDEAIAHLDAHEEIVGIRTTLMQIAGS